MKKYRRKRPAELPPVVQLCTPYYGQPKLPRCVQLHFDFAPPPMRRLRFTYFDHGR